MADSSVDNPSGTDKPKRSKRGRDPVKRRAWRIAREATKREELNAAMRAWRAANKEHVREYRRNRRVSLGLPVPKPTPKAPEEIRAHRAKSQRDRKAARSPEKITQDRDRDAKNQRTRRLRDGKKVRETENRWRTGYTTRRNEEPEFRLRKTLRSRILSAIRSDAKGGSAVRNLGCTITEFKIYIEGLFLPRMAWGNWTRKGWHLDHIKPLASFDLTDPMQCAEAMHYTNYQPLWWRDNLSKGRRYAC